MKSQLFALVQVLCVLLGSAISAPFSGNDNFLPSGFGSSGFGSAALAQTMTMVMAATPMVIMPMTMTMTMRRPKSLHSTPRRADRAVCFKRDPLPKLVLIRTVFLKPARRPLGKPASTRKMITARVVAACITLKAAMTGRASN
ncbi:hypothetical protein O181_003525 [Austropuccinia psidii MF-1]|uniref:Uncharacterized protein n=1 Tax=Austropuccinia psidii MF-1 TaxID=1389203 RepID=A0A9Q3GE00_9BASI|nr:hypothetical protein [Austropuccinia psidii MF-1]